MPARNSAGSRSSFFPWRDRDLPGSWGILVCMPCSKTPVRPATPGHLGARREPSVATTTSALTGAMFSGLDCMAYPLAVYASQHGSPRCHARLASGWLPCLGRAGSVPAGFQWKFQSFIIPFLQAWPGAMLRIEGFGECVARIARQGDSDPSRGSSHVGLDQRRIAVRATCYPDSSMRNTLLAACEGRDAE